MLRSARSNPVEPSPTCSQVTTYSGIDPQIGTTGVSVTNHVDYATSSDVTSANASANASTSAPAGGWASPEMNITFYDGEADPFVGARPRLPVRRHVEKVVRLINN